MYIDIAPFLLDFKADLSLLIFYQFRTCTAYIDLSHA